MIRSSFTTWEGEATAEPNASALMAQRELRPSRIGFETASRLLPRFVLVAFTAFAPCSTAHAVTQVPSADGQYWDIQDTSAWAQDSGGIATGGRSNPFNGFGYLKLQVRAGENKLSCRNQYLHGFGLARDGERFDSITPLVVGDVV